MTFSHIAWAYLYSHREICETAMTDPVISYSCHFPHMRQYMWIPVFSPLHRIFENMDTPQYVFSVIPKAKRWHETKHIDSRADGQAQVVPADIYKVPLLPLGMEPRSSAPLGDSDMEESLLLITHTVNLTSNLIELWLFSAALALFTLPTTGHNHSSSSQLSAHIYRPIQKQIARLCSLLCWNRHLLLVLAHLTLFHFYLAVISPPLLLSSYLFSSLIFPSLPLIRSQTMSTVIQINFKTHLSFFLSPSICTKPVRSYSRKLMFSKTLSKVDKFDNTRLTLQCGHKISFLSCDISFTNIAKRLSLASDVMGPCFCSLQLLSVIFFLFVSKAYSQAVVRQLHRCKTVI